MSDQLDPTAVERAAQVIDPRAWDDSLFWACDPPLPADQVAPGRDLQRRRQQEARVKAAAVLAAAAQGGHVVWGQSVQVLLDQARSGANVLTNAAAILEHLVMDTPEDQDTNDKVVRSLREASHAITTWVARVTGEQVTDSTATP